MVGKLVLRAGGGGATQAQGRGSCVPGCSGVVLLSVLYFRSSAFSVAGGRRRRKELDSGEPWVPAGRQ